MYINLFLILFVIILGLLLSTNDNDKNRRLYIVLCSVVLLFVAAMRSPEWMTSTYHIDTFPYQSLFEDTIDSGWSGFWANVYSRYWLHEGENDVGYLALQLIIGLFTHSFFIFSLVADLLFFVPFGIILYRYSTNIRQIIFAYVFYIALVQVFLLGGARQIFAIGFDMMAFLAIVDRKTWRAIIFLLLGVSIHFSSFLFVIPLLMIRFQTAPRVLKVLHFVCFLAVPIALLFPNQIIIFMGETVGIEKFANYGNQEIQGGATTFIILIELLSLFCFMAIKKTDLENHDNVRMLYIMTPLMTVLAPLIISNGAMIRVSLYFHLFLSLLVPFAIDCMFRVKNRVIVYVVAIAALVFLTLSGGGIRYYFYWQVSPLIGV